MDRLRSKYKGLRAREIDIKRELSRVRTMPRIQVLSWLDEVENLRNQAKNIEKSFGNKKTRDRSAYELSRKMDQHQQASPPLNGLTVREITYVDQCPERSMLYNTICQNLMDPKVGIISIYGCTAVGKSMMRDVRIDSSILSTFYLIITVSVSRAFSLHKVQSDIALQMNLDLPARDGAAMLLEAFQKSGRFLIIFDDLWQPIPLLEMGIPQPEKGSKIILIAGSFDVCPPMKPDKVIRIDPFYPGEKWGLSVERAGNTVLAPERSKLLGTIAENLMDPNVGIISIYGYGGVGTTTAMRNVSTQLSKSGIFDSIITVSMGFNWWSTSSYLWEVQSDIALQMNLDLPANDGYKARGAVLLEAFQNIGKFLIIFDDVRVPIPLLEMGIPQLIRGYGSKIVLISLSADVCLHMKPDRVNKTDSLSLGGEWDMFVERAANTVLAPEEWDIFVERAANTILAPERSKLLGTISENLMDPNVGIISIYGYEGVGKTTAMRNVSTQLSKSGIFDSIITVSMGLSLHEVQSDVALQMNLDLPTLDHCRVAVLLEAFQNIGRFLIIFDDLWQLVPLLEMGIPQPTRGCGSKIVLISRSFDICRSMKPDRVIRIDPLSPREKWDMFVERAGDTVLAPEIRPFAGQIVDICPNLPFMVTMIGHAMRDESSIQVWKNVLHNQNPRQRRGERILRICYSRLNNETVENCFLYCALFPQGHLFKSEELIKYWIGEGFMNSERNIVTEIDDGFRMIRELVDANMLEMFIVNEDDRLKVPQVCRNLAIDIMKKEPRCWVNCHLVGARKVSLIESQLERLDSSPINYDNISSLLVNRNPILYIYNSYFYPMHALALLDLSHTCLEELPQSLSQLVKLRALFLQYCRSLSRIPSLKEMKELQLINLAGTSITELPEGMEGMVSLRSLNLSETTKLKKIRSGLLSSLSGLEELLMQGSELCKLDSPMVANYLKEMRCLKRLAILNISTVSCIDLLDTVVCLQEQNLQIYSINLYGSTSDYSEDV